MSGAPDALRFAIGPRRRRVRPQWRRAIRAVRELVRHPERTQLAFEVTLALDPDHRERALEQMLAHPEGRRVYRRRPRLQAALTDRAALARLPEGSFGRAYLRHVDRHGLDPGKLVALGRAADARRAEAADDDVRWMGERGELAHDLWHVLTGYGADGIGEATLLWFSLAQTGGRANGLLSFGAGLRVLRSRGPRWIPYAWTAWRRGRRAVALNALPYEELLARPLDEVRRAVDIDPPERAHPGGVWRGEVGPRASPGTVAAAPRPLE